MIDTEKLKVLQYHQFELDSLKGDLKQKQEEFDKQNKELLEKIQARNSDIEATKEELTSQALSEYQETQNKKLTGGLGIRKGVTLIYEEKDALEWARTNMAVAVKEIVDTKMFEKFAKEDENDLTFVMKEEKTTVTFPKTISIEDDEK